MEEGEVQVPRDQQGPHCDDFGDTVPLSARKLQPPAHMLRCGDNRTGWGGKSQRQAGHVVTETAVKRRDRVKPRKPYHSGS